MCSCPDGKTGSDCGTDIDYCADNPCIGEATCTNDRDGTFTCLCPERFTGLNCETPLELEPEAERQSGTINQGK